MNVNEWIPAVINLYLRFTVTVIASNSLKNAQRATIWLTECVNVCTSDYFWVNDPTCNEFVSQVYTYTALVHKWGYWWMSECLPTLANMPRTCPLHAQYFFITEYLCTTCIIFASDIHIHVLALFTLCLFLVQQALYKSDYLSYQHPFSIHRARPGSPTTRSALWMPSCPCTRRRRPTVLRWALCCRRRGHTVSWTMASVACWAWTSGLLTEAHKLSGK